MSLNPLNFEAWFQSKHPRIPLSGVKAVLRLVEEGGTVPFIARYRKDQTGNLDEVAVATAIESRETWETLEKRKTFVLKEIESQGKLSDELRLAIISCADLDRLEDYYLPYKKKRKTKAVIAREAGLEPLANWIWDVGHGMSADQTLLQFSEAFVDPEKGVADSSAALDGARHLLIERLSERVDLRQFVRDQIFAKGGITSSPGDKPDEGGKFEQYLDHSESIESLMKPQNSHRYLAMRRGEAENILSLKVCGTSDHSQLEDDLMQRFQREAYSDGSEDVREILLRAARFAFKLYVLPVIETEVHRTLKDAADLVAIDVFAENVRKVLLAAPLGSKSVLGVDPGLRTGCKLALVDDAGQFVAESVVYLHKAEERARCVSLVQKLVTERGLHAIAVGNGTGSREAESFFREVVKDSKVEVHVVMVNEAGASIYSASEVARQEFPALDITVRGAISIARRLQDPLAELVKIDPKSIGVGQYQHDVSQTGLKKSLERVVESCVNAVGVDLNTASEHLLAYVSGLGKSLAKSIIEHRAEQGLFVSREQLKEVARFGEKAFEQSAGFLRIHGAKNPLDNTGVHPEHYASIKRYAESQGCAVEDFLGTGASALRNATELKGEIGELALADIIEELEKPGRDPRDSFVPFAYKEGVHEIKDLKVGMQCPGIVTNVTNFGAFVDVGVHQDGLVHISQLSDSFVKDPREVVSPGDRVIVVVTEVEVDRKRIGFSMRSDARQQISQAQSGVGQDRVQSVGSSAGGKRINNHKRGNERPKVSGGRQESSSKGNTRGNSAGGRKDDFSNTPFAALKNLNLKVS